MYKPVLRLRLLCSTVQYIFKICAMTEVTQSVWQATCLTTDLAFSQFLAEMMLGLFGQMWFVNKLWTHYCCSSIGHFSSSLSGEIEINIDAGWIDKKQVEQREKGHGKKQKPFKRMQ